MKHPDSISLSIVIVSWNTRALLEECLASIEHARLALAYEVIVVDNGSSDGTVAMLHTEFPQVRVLANVTNKGFAQANNQGIRMARGKYFLLLNSDTVVPPGSVDLMVAYLVSHPEVGIVGPRLVYPSGAEQPSWASFPSLWSELTGRNLRRREPHASGEGLSAYLVDWVGGAALLTHDRVTASIGLLDESIPMYTEETDFCFRAGQAGWKCCYLEEAVIIHLGGGSASRSSLRQLRLLYESKLYYFAKHKGRLQSGLLRMGLIVVTAAGIARRLLGAAFDAPHGAEQAKERNASILARLQLLQVLATPK